MCQVVNLYKESYDIYIGRARRGDPYNIWCNPNPLVNPKDDVERESNILQYRLYLKKQIQLGVITIDMLASLDGKRLGCFCKPKMCHGDILVKACNWAKQIKWERDNV